MSDEISHGELTRWLGRVEDKLDTAIQDHEQRLRRVERIMYVAIGLSITAVGSGVSVLLRLIGG